MQVEFVPRSSGSRQIDRQSAMEWCACRVDERGMAPAVVTRPVEPIVRSDLASLVGGFIHRDTLYVVHGGSLRALPKGTAEKHIKAKKVVNL